MDTSLFALLLLAFCVGFALGVAYASIYYVVATRRQRRRRANITYPYVIMDSQRDREGQE